MATLPTSIGPIGARQINQNLYVGHSDLVTIQAAVTFAVAQGGIFTVYVPPEYAGTDTIAAVTGGSANVYIMDERNGQRESYLWFNNVYRPEPIFPAGVSTPQMNHYIYVGVQGYWATIQAAINSAASFETDNIIIITTSYHGTEAIDALTGGETGIFLIDQRTPQMQVYEWNGTNYVPSDFEPMGNIVAHGITAAAMNVGDLTATDVAFDSATVDGSNVVTFANIGEVGGMDWPPPGIAVSTGTDWEPSLDPASVAGYPPPGIPVSSGTAWSAALDPANLATWPAAGIAVSTGTAWGTPIAPGSLLAYPPSGIAVSTGVAWSAPINPANLATWPAAGVPVSTGTAWGTPIVAATLARYPPSGIALSTGTAWGTPIDPATLATWPAAGIPVSTGTAWGAPIAAANVALLNQANTFTGAVTAGGGLATTGIPAGVPNSAHLGVSGGVGYLDFVGANTTTQGAGQFRCMSSNASLLTSVMSMTPTAVTFTPPVTIASRVTISASAGTANVDFIGPSTTTQGGAWIRTAMSDGSSPVYMIQLSGLITLNAYTNVAGNLYASGTITSGGSKSFRIRHPLDATKDLVHACIEGPECAVFYRGDGVTSGGWAEITLPDYFEALTMKEHRSINLTALFEEDDEPISTIAASRVKNGKFKVWSALPTQKFYWEVLAVRADIDPLEVETTKMTPLAQPPGEGEEEYEPTAKAKKRYKN